MASATVNDSRHPGPHTARWLIFALCVSVLLALTLLRFPPEQYTFYPRCPVFTLLHLQCPGCGTTRALAALLHGHLREALRLNALTVCTLPAILLHLAWRSNRISPPAAETPLLIALLVVAAVFTVARNL